MKHLLRHRTILESGATIVMYTSNTKLIFYT